MGDFTPSIKNALVADQVFRQEGGKWCVIGVFDTIWANRFPVVHPSLGIFVRVSDAEGTYALRVELQDSTGKCIAAVGEVALKVDHRLAEADLGIQTHNLPIPAAGTYFLRFLFNGVAVPADVRLNAKTKEELFHA